MVSHDRDFLDRLASGIIAFEAPGQVGDYAGGYSDYRRQRREQEAPRRHKASAKGGTRDKPASTRVRSKLSYKDQRELDRLPAEMEKLTAEIAALDAQLAAADYYQRDPVGFKTAADRLASCRASLEEAEERWLELEDLKERLQVEAGAG